MSKSSVTKLTASLVAKDKLQQAEAEKFIKAMFDVANTGLQADKLLKMRWLGTFKVQATKDRESIDVNTGERILIEGRDKICFTPDNVLKDIVNKPFAQFETVILNDDIDFSGIDEKYEETEDFNAIKEEGLNMVENTEKENCVEKNVQDEKDSDNTVLFFDSLVTPQQTVSDQVVVIGAKTTEQEFLADATPIIPQTVKETATIEEDISENDTLEEPGTVASETSHTQGHILRYFIVAVVLFAIIAIGGFAWFSFSYQQMSARCEQLALQLEGLKYHKHAATAPLPSASSKQIAAHRDSDSLKMAMKQKEDSVRMLQASKAIEQVSKETPKTYDSDIRIKTGAYRIVGTAQTITVKHGQTLSSISKSYLGPGMDCYVEAYNEITEVKEGQKIKIPKLEIKKRKQ